MNFLEVTGLKKSFGMKPILRGVNLALAGGERMALLGANGTGKTTLLRILVGLARPDAGTACIDGLDIVRDAQGVRKIVGFVAHQPYLYDELTAMENLLFFAKLYTVRDAKERARNLLQKVGLEKRAKDRVSTLSRGQVQRLSLARALLHSPRLLLLDEPETGLDQEGTRLVSAILEEHSAEGGSVLFTTHQLERSLALSDRIVMLHKGRIVLQQQTAAVNIEFVRQTYQEATYP